MRKMKQKNAANADLVTKRGTDAARGSALRMAQKAEKSWVDDHPYILGFMFFVLVGSSIFGMFQVVFTGSTLYAQ